MTTPWLQPRPGRCTAWAGLCREPCCGQGRWPERRPARPGRLVRTWYRALTADGKLWCESSDPEEIASLARLLEPGDQPATLQRMDIYETTDGWQEWVP